MTDPAKIQEAQSLLAQAIAAYHAQDLNRARQLCHQAAKANPADPEPHNMLGVVAGEAGNYRQAADQFREAIALAPHNLNYRSNLAASLKGDKRLEDSLAVLKEILELDPTDSTAFKEALTLSMDLKDFEYAISLTDRILASNPNQFEALDMKSNILEEKKDYSGLIPVYSKIISIKPEVPLGLYMKQVRALQLTRQYQKAVDLLFQMLDRFGPISDTYFSIGMSYNFLAEFEKAKEYLSQAVLNYPSIPEARLMLGLLEMMTSGYKRGFDSYESRYIVYKMQPRPYNFAPWMGQPLEGKRILIWSEQGVGDIAMFAGFLPYIASRAEHVTFETYSRMVPLFQCSFPNIEVVPMTDEVFNRLMKEPFDYHCSLVELLRYCVDNYKPRQLRGYLKADPERVTALRQKYDNILGPGMKVGISWHTVAEANGMMRRIPLKEWAPILKTPGVHFISQQYGDHQEEIDAVFQQTGVRVYVDPDIDHKVHFDEYAAQVMAMDHIINIQNANAHMAGALGKNCWLMISRAADWRWGTEGEKSIWYDSVRIMRQAVAEDWTVIISLVASLLQDELKKFQKNAG